MPTFLVLGATGATGVHFVQIALEKGNNTKVVVRNPSKLKPELKDNPSLQVFEGSFTDAAVLEKAVPGSDYIVVMAGDKKLSSKSKFMTDFVKRLLPIMRKHGVKRLLYQAGAFSPAPGVPLDFGTKVLRATVGRMMGLTGMIADNDGVIQYLSENATDTEWIVTRPGMLQEKPSQGKLQRSSKMGGSASFVDLALLNYETVLDAAAVHTCDCVAYAK